MVDLVWFGVTVLLAVFISVALTTRLMLSDMRKDRALQRELHEALTATYKERAEYLETQVAYYKAPSMNGHRAA